MSAQDPVPPRGPTGRGSRPDKRAREPSRRIVDRIAGPIDAFHIMTEADAEKANAVLEGLVEGDEIEQEILGELLDAKPLAEPRAFAALHRSFVRALEVYDRNARRAPSGLSAGVLRPLITPIVALLTRAMASSYQTRVIGEARRLYLLREANSAVGSADHRMLVTARRQLDAIQADRSGQRHIIPAFLLGGAALSAVASVLNDLLHSHAGRFSLLAIVLLLTVGAFWCLVTAAALTRRRMRLILDQPLTILWRAIGGAGRPPREPSRLFVTVAMILLLIGWILAPLTFAVILNLT